MTTRVVEARRGHVLLVARRLDPETLKLAAERAVDPRMTLIDAWAQSREAWALLADGCAVAVGGWKGSLLAGEAEAWLTVTPEARLHRFALARAVVHQARRLADRGMTIAAWVAAGDARAARFAAWCGLDPAEARQGMRRYEFTNGWADLLRLDEVA